MMDEQVKQFLFGVLWYKIALVFGSSFACPPVLEWMAVDKLV